MTRVFKQIRPADDRRKIYAGFSDYRLTVRCLGPEDLGRLMDFRARILANLDHADNLGRFVGFKVAGILAEGKPVASLPIETLKRFSLLINMPVAAALQLYPPLPMLNVAEVLGVPGSDPGGPPPR